MGQLDTDLSTGGVNKVNNTLETRDMIIIVDTSTSRTNTTTGLNSSGLSKDQPSSVKGKGTQVDQMVIGHETVLGRVHAHGGNNDTVGDGEVLGGEGLEEQGEGGSGGSSLGGGGCNGGGAGSGGNWGDDVEVLLREGLLRDVALVEEGIGDGLDGLIVLSGGHIFFFWFVRRVRVERRELKREEK